MFFLLSGEGPTDMGTCSSEGETQFGPMAHWVDQWVARRLGYSVIDSDGATLLPESSLAEHAKKKMRGGRIGKKGTGVETRYFYKNARALAQLAKELCEKNGGVSVIAVLFRDSDGTVSSERGLWEAKRNSMMQGFADEEYDLGVPMIPKPKSESWILCAVNNSYMHCAALEDASGNDHSPNSLKSQLAESMPVPVSRDSLCDLVLNKTVDIENITDMPSLNAFTNRLDDVLIALGLHRER